MDRAQGRKWIEEHLVLVEARGGRADNCYADGTHVYRRKDGQPVSDEDLQAVQADDAYGQVNRPKKTDEFTIERYWACDSSG